MSEPDFTLPQRRAAKARLESAGGGGDDQGMLERRVAVLEGDMKEVKGSLGRIERLLEKMDGRLDRADERLRKVEVDIAGLRERAAALPTTWTVLLAMFGMAFTVSGLILAIMRFGVPR